MLVMLPAIKLAAPQYFQANEHRDSKSATSTSPLLYPRKRIA